MQICSIIVLQHILITSTFIFNSKDTYWHIFASYNHRDYVKNSVIENLKLIIAIINKLDRFQLIINIY